MVTDDDLVPFGLHDNSTCQTWRLAPIRDYRKSSWVFEYDKRGFCLMLNSAYNYNF